MVKKERNQVRKAMIKTNASRAAVLFVAYVSVFLCSFIEDYYIYYTSLMFSCFTMISVCTYFKSDKILFFYAVIQFIAMTAYYFMQLNFYWAARIALYSDIFSIKNVMMAYELFIISYIGADLVRAAATWLSDANCIYRFVNKIS